MKVKFEIERKIEDDNGKKSEKETTITFDDVLDVKSKVKSVGAFLAKKAKKTAEIAGDITDNVAYNAAAITADVLDLVADTADTAVNAIDRFINNKFGIVEEDCECEECCGECCCGETCDEDLADILDGIINELENEDDESEEDGVENDAESVSEEETSEDDSSAKSEEDPIEAFIKGVIGDVEKISTDVIAFITADNAEKAETIKMVREYIDKFGLNLANHLGIKIKKSEETSGEEEDAYEDEIEKVSDDSSETAESEEVIGSKKDFADKIAEIPEGKKFKLAEYLDYLGMYRCEEKTVNMEKEVGVFFTSIGYCPSIESRIAFEKSVTLEKINYNNVADKVMESIPSKSKGDVIEQLKADFDNWLKVHEDVKKYCSKPEFRYLLAYFVEKVRGC